MDERLRRRYRAHRTTPDDPGRRARIQRDLERLGPFCVRYPPLDEPEPDDPWESLDEDLRLHTRSRRLPNACSCAWCCGKNAKRKTLRTHRDPKSRRGFRLR